MKNKDTQDKSEAIGRKLIKLIYDETIMLSQKHEVGQTIAIIEMATILALSSTAFTLSKMLMSEADRNNFIKDFKEIMIDVLDKASLIKASDLVRH